MRYASATARRPLHGLAARPFTARGPYGLLREASAMTTTTHDHAEAQAHRSALLTRLGSFLAFLPLAVWTTWHLWENLAAWSGAAAWESAVTTPKSPLSSLESADARSVLRSEIT